MKLFKSFIMGLAAVSTLTLVSCNDWLDVNDDPDNPALTTVSVATELPWIQYHLGYAMGAHAFRSQAICLAMTDASRVRRDGCSSQWEPTSSLSTTCYQQFFVGSGPAIRDGYAKAVESGAWHYAAAIKLLKAYGFLLMADMYGEMPYTDAVTTSAHPYYDDGRTIYLGCLADIDEAIENFGKKQEMNCPALSEGDSWNGGSIDKWVKMAYLLKARTINQLSKKGPGSYKDGKYDEAEILACLEKAQKSIDDDTYIQHEDVKESSSDFISTDPMKTNFLWNQTYNSNRHMEMPTKWIEDLLIDFDGKGIEDPRCDKLMPWRQYNVDGEKVWMRGKGVDLNSDVRMNPVNNLAVFISRKADNSGWQPSNDKRAADSVYVGLYAGSVGVYGNGNVMYGPVNGWYPSSGMVYVRPNSPYLWATYTEACFIKAEVLFRKGDKAGAFEAYKKGIQSNIDEINKMLTIWTGGDYDNCPSFGKMDQDKIDNFMNNAIGTAADITMEKIMTQKFVSMLYSTQNWNDMRRHDYKDYMGWQLPYEYAQNAGSLKAIPQGKDWRRIKQCSHEYNYNATELRKITPFFNDDDMWTIPVWWDTATEDEYFNYLSK
ncbi:MAG: SusD/RagB family nutrient-binding outer membrane lipoprotein [Muribaculaceae bacterium]|nr:SusD/RagB family nutrient-binding outer membrane lipoprotein [Muribaculaceae bacterium]